MQFSVCSWPWMATTAMETSDRQTERRRQIKSAVGPCRLLDLYDQCEREKVVSGHVNLRRWAKHTSTNNKQNRKKEMSSSSFGHIRNMMRIHGNVNWFSPDSHQRFKDVHSLEVWTIIRTDHTNHMKIRNTTRRKTTNNDNQSNWTR